MSLGPRKVANSFKFGIPDAVLFILLMNFGFMGWGVRSLVTSSSYSWLFSIVLPLPVFFSIYLYSKFSSDSPPISRYSGIITRSRVLVWCSCFFVFISLQVWSRGLWLELTGDEIAYARNAFGPGIVLMEHFAGKSYFERINPITFLRLTNWIFYISSISFFLLLTKLRNPKWKILAFAVVTMVLRLIISMISDVQSPNPPMYSYFLGLLLNVMPLGDFWVRLSMFIIVTGIFSAILSRIFERFGKFVGLIVLGTTTMNFAVSKTFTIIEPAVIGFLIILYVVTLANTRNIRLVTDNTIVGLSILSYVRVSALAFGLFLCILKLYEQYKSGDLKSKQNNWKKQASILALCVSIGTTFFPQRIHQYTGNVGQDISSSRPAGTLNPLFQWSEISKYVLANLGYWQTLLFCLLVLLLCMKLRENYVIFIFLLLAAFQFALASKPSSPYASKYVLEFIAPFTLYVIMKINAPRVIFRMMALISLVLMISISSLFQLDLINRESRIKEDQIASISRLEELIYRYSLRPQFKVQELYQAASEMDKFDCLEVGINYGVWQQVLSGYTFSQIAKQVDINRQMHNKAMKTGESFGKYSTQSLSGINTNCLILQPSVTQEAVLKSYLNDDWKVVSEARDFKSSLSTFLILKKFHQ